MKANKILFCLRNEPDYQYSSSGNPSPSHTSSGSSSYFSATLSAFPASVNSLFPLPVKMLPGDKLVVFEVIAFLYSFVAMMLQHLHIYRTVFWLNTSHQDNAMVRLRGKLLLRGIS